MHIKDIFVKNLKKYRKVRGVSQMRLASLCDSSTGYIGQIEIGNKFPSIEMIEKMSQVLEIKPYLFFLDESDSEPQAAVDRPSTKLHDMPETAKEELIKQLNDAIRRVVRKH
jgi:transcriptional regulator with XRE-family HTH domain